MSRRFYTKLFLIPVIQAIVLNILASLWSFEYDLSTTVICIISFVFIAIYSFLNFILLSKINHNGMLLLTFLSSEFLVIIFFFAELALKNILFKHQNDDNEIAAQIGMILFFGILIVLFVAKIVIFIVKIVINARKNKEGTRIDIK